MFHEFPVIPAHPSDWEYFWFKLPYALPGFVSFIVGFLLFLVGLYAAHKKHRSEMSRFYSFAVMCLSYGCLGLIMSLRAVLQDRELLLLLHSIIYPVMLLVIPCYSYFGYLVMNRRYRFLVPFTGLGILAVLFAYTGIIKQELFTANGITFSFGYYPKASFYVKPWALTGAAGAMVIGPLCWLHFLFIRKEKADRNIALGLNLASVLIASNAPATILGLDIFPMGTFMFVALLLVAYGTFRTDFFDLNDLIYNKSVLFYTVCIIIGMTFLAFSLTIAYSFNPDEYKAVSWFPWTLIPLLSCIFVFILGITIAGSNPTERINQLAGLTMFFVGFYTIQGILRTLPLQPIVAMRIDQICYIFFMASPGVQLRFILLVIERPYPRYIYLVDLLAFALSAITFTPLMFKGYYTYSFGNIPAGGPGTTLLGAFAVSVLLLALFYVTNSLRRNPNRFTAFITGGVVVGGLLLIMSVPATKGYSVYSFGNLYFLPAAFFAVGVFNYRGIRIRHHAFRISKRVTVLSFLLLPIFALVFFAELKNYNNGGGIVLHYLLIFSALFIFTYMMMYIMTRPVTQSIDEQYQLLQKEKSRSDDLLTNILPEEVAFEIKEKGRVKPIHYSRATILFTDFKDFTASAARMTPRELVTELDSHFTRFDEIITHYNLEKLKTIGDAYMCVGGIPRPSNTQVLDAVMAAMAIQRTNRQLRTENSETGWDLRIGIHCGPVVGGVIGKHKFAFDIWGDSVNIASRIESNSQPGKINISEQVYDEIKFLFVTRFRGSVKVKNRGELNMYFVERIKPVFSADEHGQVPNDAFLDIYHRIKNGARLVAKKKPEVTSADLKEAGALTAGSGPAPAVTP